MGEESNYPDQSKLLALRTSVAHRSWKCLSFLLAYWFISLPVLVISGVIIFAWRYQPYAEEQYLIQAWNGDLSKIKWYSLWADLDARDILGNTALHDAAFTNGLEIIEWLIKKGIDVNIKNQRGQTPLIKACESNSIPAVKMLLDYGADIHQDAIDIACMNGNLALLKFLESRGADLRIKGDVENEHSALQAATWHNQIEIVKYLLASGADVNVWNGRSETAMHVACTFGYGELIKLFVDNGYEINKRSFRGFTALHVLCWTAASSPPGSIELLLKKGIDINATCKKGKTALWYARKIKHHEAIYLLIMSGASLHVPALDDDPNPTVFDIPKYLDMPNPWVF